MARVPAYFDHLLEAFSRGDVGRAVHLGFWETSPSWIAGGEPPPGDFARAQRRLDERVVSLAALADGQRVLDVGCGLGATLERIARLHRGMELAGLNVDLRQLAACRDLDPGPGNRISWVGADAVQLPFPAASWDRVLCVEAMFHFPSRRRFYEEAARVLAPGGVMVVTDIVTSPGPGADASPLLAALVEGYGPWPDAMGRDSDHAVLARDAGLEILQALDVTEGTRPSHRFTAPACALDEAPDTGSRAAVALRLLHDAGGLRYPLLAFRKPA